MPRKSPVHYIAPNVLSITPNCNGSFNDLAVTVVKGGKVKVFSEGVKELATQDAYYQEWTFSGRNRRLNDSEGTTEFTIYLRLPKNDKSGGYLVFAPKDKRGDTWVDKYCTVTMNGLTKHGSTGTDARVLDHNNWYIRIGDVSLPEGGKRTVTLDLGILGTDQFNNEWNLDPDDMPLRLSLSGTIDGVDAGTTPYVAWGKTLVLTAKLVEGWADSSIGDSSVFWEISRNSGDPSADSNWPSESRAKAFGKSGSISLAHVRSGDDDFNNAFSSVFTVIAWGRDDSDSSSSSSSSSSSTGDLVPLAMGSITVMAETVEKFELELSTNVVSYDPTSDTYGPSDGVNVQIRATDQRSNVFKLTRGQMDTAGLTVEYAVTGSDDWQQLPFNNPPSAMAEAAIPITFFRLQQNVNVRILRSMSSDEGSSSSGGSGMTTVEIYRTNIAFVRNGEDSKDREWIYLRSETAITFGDLDSPHPLPALIPLGEVEPGDRAAAGNDADKNQDGWVPNGWWDEMQGTSEEFHYEYGAYRDYIRDGGSSSSDEGSSSDGDATQRGGHWGEFSEPRIWSYYGDDAVTYRCRWTLNGQEVFQLKGSYTGAFKGTLPLVATLMKRKGNNPEEQVTGHSVITVHFDGLPDSQQPADAFNADNPIFIISSNQHAQFIPYLNNKDLSSISIGFNTGGEVYNYNISMVHEADEDSVKNSIEEIGSELFLSKKHDDTAEGLIAFLQGLKFGDLESQYGVTGRGVGTFLELISNFLHTAGFVKESGLAGLGFGVTTAANGWATTQTDDLIVLGRMFVNTLNIREVSYIGGVYLLTPAGSTVQRVQNLYTTAQDYGDTRYWTPDDVGGLVVGYRLLWKADDGTTSTMNYWQPGDQAFCEIFNINQAGQYDNFHNRRYWRLVCRVGHTTVDGKEYNYADLSDIGAVRLYKLVNDEWVPVMNEGGKSNTFIGYEGFKDSVNNNSVPDVDDKVVCLGSQADVRRQAAIQISAEGTGSFGIYDGINDYEPLATYEIHFMSKDAVRMRSSKFEWTTDTGVHKPPTVYLGDWVEGNVSYWGIEWTYQGRNWLCVMPRDAVDPDSQNVETGQTRQAPGTNPAWWVDNKGDSGKTYSLGFYTDGEDPTPIMGLAVRPASVDEKIKPYLLYGQDDISDSVTAWKWERESSYSQLDGSWGNEPVPYDDLPSEYNPESPDYDPTLVRPKRNAYRLLHLTTEDLPAGWDTAGGKVGFKCIATFSDGGEQAQIINRISIV